MMTAWQNRTNRDWHGDLYVDMTGPFSGVRIVRRDSNVRIPESIGFCTYDRTRLPGLGVYLVTSRALRRDGAATEQWEPSGTTEITAVCNGFYCELIRPHQRRARLTLRGDSAIHLMSDFFSEFTRVTLEASGFVFDITDLCRVEQNPHGSKKTHITVYFNTRDLPMEADEWAYYTIEIHPMPVVPEGAKLEDSLWIRTKVRESLE
jgi:hypothetical protein